MIYVIFLFYSISFIMGLLFLFPVRRSRLVPIGTYDARKV